MACIQDETMVVNLVAKNEFCKELSIFKEHHFNVYSSLIRMNCVGKRSHTVPAESDKVRNAETDDLFAVNQLLTTYFDPFAEQLPDTSDLIGWIKNNSIIVYKERDKVVGFIIYDLTESTLYLRYWFVHPDFRDKKIGSQLFKEFLARGKNTQRQLFWVIRSNENAIKRYRHYGFEEEKMYNYVLTNKKIKYEK
jgi:ribosomal protein S18 acetylase RimI-like enzyme